MFTHDQTSGRAVCVAAYGRVKRGAVVPQGNELWADVEAWLAEGNALGAFAGYPDTRPLSDLKAAKLNEINRAYSAELATILDQYPHAETLTFDKQEREARAWDADNTTATPYLDAMLVERPLTKADLVTRIIAKADQFTAASGAATGKRQRLEDDIAAAEDLATLEGITW